MNGKKRKRKDRPRKRAIGVPHKIVRRSPLTLSKCDFDAGKILAPTRHRSYGFSGPTHASDVDEAFGIGPTNFGDGIDGIDDIEWVVGFAVVDDRIQKRWGGQTENHQWVLIRRLRLRRRRIRRSEATKDGWSGREGGRFHPAGECGSERGASLKLRFILVPGRKG